MEDAARIDDPAVARPLLVIPDANVLIHGKALVDLPWSELGHAFIEIVLVPPMIRELDKLKVQTGRPNKIARQLSSDIRKLIAAPGRQTEIRRFQPRVSKRVDLQAVSEPLHPALRLDHPDQALINYALQLAQIGADVLLLTDDTICYTTAEEVGLNVMFLPETWLRSEEPDANTREIAKLKTEIQRLSTNEPLIELGFTNEAGVRVTELNTTITRWLALDEAAIDLLMDKVEQLCPPATSFERSLGRGVNALGGGRANVGRIGQIGALSGQTTYEPASEEEINRYKTAHYPTWLQSVRAGLETLHERLDARTVWPPIVARADNRGSRPAEDVLLTIRARGAFQFLNDEGAEEDVSQAPDLHGFPELPLPPPPPRGRMKPIRTLGLHRGDERMMGVVQHPPFTFPHHSFPDTKDADAFYWRVGQRDLTDEMELTCAMWRHGRASHDFRLRILPVGRVSTAGVIEFDVHASNMTDPTVVRLPVRIEFANGRIFEEAEALVEMLGRHARAQDRL